MCVTVVIVAVCSIATVRWWLLLFCLSNIEIVFKSLMMLYYYFFRVHNEKVPWLQVSKGRLFVSLICLGPYSDLLSLGLVSRYLLVCLRMSFLFQIGRSKEHFSTFDSQTLQYFLLCVVGVGLRGGMVCNQWCDDFGGIGGFLVVGHLCDFVICYS